VVTAVTDFGIFVEFADKLEGLIHISEIAWQRIDDPNDFVKVGQKIKAEIISIENSKIFLSMKKLSQDPWDGIEKKYKIGDKISGSIIKANPFGLFVEIEKNIQAWRISPSWEPKTLILKRWPSPRQDGILYRFARSQKPSPGLGTEPAQGRKKERSQGNSSV